MREVEGERLRFCCIIIPYARTHREAGPRGKVHTFDALVYEAKVANSIAATESQNRGIGYVARFKADTVTQPNSLWIISTHGCHLIVLKVRGFDYKRCGWRVMVDDPRAGV